MKLLSLDTLEISRSHNVRNKTNIELSSKILPNQWTHFTITYKQKQSCDDENDSDLGIKVYLDSKLVYEDITLNFKRPLIETDGLIFLENYAGRFTEIRFWNINLSQPIIEHTLKRPLDCVSELRKRVKMDDNDFIMANKAKQKQGKRATLVAPPTKGLSLKAGLRKAPRGSVRVPIKPKARQAEEINEEPVEQSMKSDMKSEEAEIIKLDTEDLKSQDSDKISTTRKQSYIETPSSKNKPKDNFDFDFSKSKSPKKSQTKADKFWDNEDFRSQKSEVSKIDEKSDFDDFGWEQNKAIKPIKESKKDDDDFDWDDNSKSVSKPKTDSKNTKDFDVEDWEFDQNPSKTEDKQEDTTKIDKVDQNELKEDENDQDEGEKSSQENVNNAVEKQDHDQSNELENTKEKDESEVQDDPNEKYQSETQNKPTEKDAPKKQDKLAEQDEQNKTNLDKNIDQQESIQNIDDTTENQQEIHVKDESQAVIKDKDITENDDKDEESGDIKNQKYDDTIKNETNLEQDETNYVTKQTENKNEEINVEKSIPKTETTKLTKIDKDNDFGFDFEEKPKGLKKKIKESNEDPAFGDDFDFDMPTKTKAIKEDEFDFGFDNTLSKKSKTKAKDEDFGFEDDISKIKTNKKSSKEQIESKIDQNTKHKDVHQNEKNKQHDDFNNQPISNKSTKLQKDDDFDFEFDPNPKKSPFNQKSKDIDDFFNEETKQVKVNDEFNDAFNQSMTKSKNKNSGFDDFDFDSKPKMIKIEESKIDTKSGSTFYIENAS